MIVLDFADQREFSFDIIWVRCKHRGQNTPVENTLDVMQLAKKTIQFFTGQDVDFAERAKHRQRALGTGR